MMGANDCGISLLTPLDSLSIRVTFVPDGGLAKPLEAEATDVSKWAFYTTPDDLTLALVTATKVSDYVYDLTWNHRLRPFGMGVSIESAAIGTDLGGYCDSPEVESCRSVDDPLVPQDFDTDPNNWSYGPVDNLGHPLISGGTVPHRRGSRRR